MTFYNIIFGLLFLGACQAVLVSLGTGTDTMLLMLVALLIFNDAINTSEVVEERKFTYTLPMKLFDLASFLILATTLLVLSENTKNFLDVPIYPVLPDAFKHPSAPPLLLLAYCAMVAGWNLVSPEVGRIEEWPKQLVIIATSIVIAIGALVFLRPARLDYPVIYSLLVVVAMVATLGYMFSYAFIKKK